MITATNDASPTARRAGLILGSQIDAVSWDEAVQTILDWAERNASKYVCICNVHSVVTAHHDPEFQSAINQADMNTADGYPIAWMLRRLGYPDQQRINGPDLMLKLLNKGQSAGLRIFLYGSTTATLKKLEERIACDFKGARIVGSISPPFRATTTEEEAAIADAINSTGAQIVFVGLGCPKQELWMARQRGHIQAVMIGVGAAFDYHAGTLKRAPMWMQRNGLEWLFRFIKEPRRLWKRYLVTNLIFMFYAATTLWSKTFRT